MLVRSVIFTLGFLALVFLDQSPGFTENTLFSTLRAIGVSSILFMLNIFLGAFFIKRFYPNQSPAWDVSLGLGLLCWGLLSFIAAAFGMMGMVSATVILAAMGCACFVYKDIDRPRGPLWGWVIIVIFGCFALVDACGPTIDTDAIYFHVALPKQIWIGGELLVGPLHPNGSRPMLLHAPFSMLYGLGGETTPAVFSCFIGLALLGSILQRAESLQPKAGVWAIMLLLSSWTFLHELGIAANNLSAAFFVWVCWIAISQRHYALSAIFAGAALSVKYTAFGAIGALWIFSVPGWRQKGQTALLTIAMVSVWWFWNMANGLHPLFPYAGWALDFPFQHLDKYGMGRDWMNLLLLPINAVLHSEIDNFRFLGQLHPLWLLSIPLAIGVASKTPRLGWIVLTAFVFWGVGPHWLRHLLPASPLIVLWLGFGLSRLNRIGTTIAAIALLWGLPANLGPMLTHWGARSVPSFYEDKAKAHRYERVQAWRTAEWANQRLPSNSKCALFYTWPGLAFDRPYVLGSVEDHVPSRHFLLLHDSQFIDALKAEEVDHIIVGPPTLARHLYPFLSDSDFHEQFEKPAAILENGLLRHGELIFEAASHRVYRIRK